ncbi:MAG: universal stress protein [Bacteroidia bacterium]|nr:universal stress protein [Bacteroidia bacterium]
MSDAKKTILVPWDFTEVTENALLHAINVAKKLDNDITLLHIVDKGGLLKNKSKKVHETIASTNKLNVLSSDYSTKYGVKINSIVIEGSIFTTISDVAWLLNVSMVVMGTHGMKGMQKVTGSWAMKVISGTNLPFLVVQAPPSRSELRNIIFPVDETRDSLEKLTWARFLQKCCDAKMRIVKQHFAGGTKVSSNIAVVTKFFAKYSIPFDIYEPSKKKEFTEAVIGYSHKIEADIILIMIKKDIHITDYIMGMDEQNIIFNEHKIPVMCINPGNKI